jgi:hypothetical protein
MKKAIKVSGGTRVEVSPIHTLSDLAEVAAKFAEIKQTDGAESVCTLAICVGDRHNGYRRQSRHNWRPNQRSHPQSHSCSNWRCCR